MHGNRRSAAAIADVLADLEKGSPMDRLVVGDVGFRQDRGGDARGLCRGHFGLQVAVIAPPRCWRASITAALPNGSGAFR
jgi:RecG-like helicase